MNQNGNVLSQAILLMGSLFLGFTLLAMFIGSREHSKRIDWLEKNCVKIGYNKGLKQSTVGYRCKDGMEYWE